MKFYRLEPEVAGGIGEQTIIDHSSHPPRVSQLHYEMEGWPGDELLEGFPCYIVTDSLRTKIQLAECTGVEFDSVMVSTSQEFDAIHPHRALPHFVWLKPQGRAGIDDFGMSYDHRLVISDRALGLMNLNYCDTEEFAG